MRLRDVFATNLRRARNASNLSQETLADLAGIDRSYVSELERANYAATIDMIESIANALNVEPASLLVGERTARGG
jgi:transcriptional regulator with XRE-family HTH domain